MFRLNRNRLQKIGLSSYVSLLMELINAEHERLAALAAALEYWTSPKNPDDPEDCQNPTAWRLAQLLDERLSSTNHIDMVRRVLVADFGGMG